MKKLIIIICVLATAFAAVGALFLPSSSRGTELVEKKVKIDNTRNVVLNFEGYSVKVTEWDKDYVQIKSNIMHNDSTINDLKADGNTVSSGKPKAGKQNAVLYASWPWLPLMQIGKYQHLFNDIDAVEYNYSVKVPKDVPVEITGKYIRTDGCTVSFVKGDEAKIRDGALTKDFSEEVDSLTVRDCKVPQNIVFEQQDGEIRDNTIIK